MASVATTVASGGLAAALTVIIVSEAQRAGITIGAEEAAAFGTVFGSILHYATRWLPKDISPNPPSPNPEQQQ